MVTTPATSHPEGQDTSEGQSEGQYAPSNDLLFGLDPDDANDAFYCFSVGRNFRCMDDLAQAQVWLLRSLSRDVFPWAFYELALVQKQSDDLVAAGESILRFLETAPSLSSELGLNQVHCDNILGIAHQVFLQDRPLASGIYKACGNWGLEDYLSALRIVEFLVQERRVGDAWARMSDLRARYELDPWGFLCLSRLHELRKEILASREALRQAVALGSESRHFLVQAAHRGVELGLVEDVETLLRFLRAPPGASGNAAEILGVELRLATSRHDAQQAGQLLADPLHDWREVSKWILVAAMSEFCLPGDQSTDDDLIVAEHLRVLIEAMFTATLEEVHALMNCYCRRRMWSEAEALLQEISDSDVFLHREVVVRHFELRCFMGDLDGAETIYRERIAGPELNDWETMAALRFLAERQYWSEAGEVLTTGLGRGYACPGSEHFLLQIARRASIHERLLLALDTADHGAVERPDGEKPFRQMLVDDLCILGRAPISGPAKQDVVSGRNSILCGRHFLPVPPLKHKSALFLCTDKAYFLSVLTFLSSYMECNRGTDPRPTLFVFLDNNVPVEWGWLITRFMLHLGDTVQVVREDDFVTCKLDYNNRYGIFTGGSTLARAAYYRIYAARYLCSLQEFDRLCYIDSDVVCQSELNTLLTLDLQDRPIAARCEEMSPEVSTAATRNGIEPSRYFNSGVLLLDSSCRDTRTYLDCAIHITEHEPDRLSFHDQCALNISFAAKVHPLPSEFNFFIRPFRSDNGAIGSGRLLHFLDKPKPWDVSYTREYRCLWSRHADLVKMLLDPKEYRQIVLAANSGG